MVDWIKAIAKLKWWFTFGDWLADSTGKKNNAGNFSFRANMRMWWFVLWMSITVIIPDSWELIPFLIVLWSAYVWHTDGD